MGTFLASIIIFAISSMVFIYNYKNKNIIWFSFIGYTVSLGTLGAFLNDYKSFIILGDILYILSYCFAPYFFLLAIFCYIESNAKEELAGKSIKKLIFLILPVISFIIYIIIYSWYGNKDVICFKVFNAIWVAFYFIVSDYNLFVQYRQEKIPILRSQKFYIFLLLFCSTTYGFISSHMFPFFNINNIYDIYFSLILIIGFLYFCIRHGFFGLRIFFEKYNPIKELMTMNTDISILNHTLKKELDKVAICCDNIKTQANNKNEIIDRNVNIIINSSEHILEMVSRIEKYTYDFSIIENEFELANIIEKVVEMMSPDIEGKNIRINKDLRYNAKLLADCSHIQEVLLNLLTNSVEAINHNGEILINTKKNNKFIIIEVIDNGCGIDKNDLKKIHRPFFTTKNSKTNFGLGLAYCTNVIQKHGGKLLILSHKGIGTKVSICLPVSRI